MLNDRLVDLVEEGFDAALRTGVIADQRIVARPLRPLRWVTVASPGYLARCGAPDDVAALQGHACLAVRNLRSGRLDWQFLQDGQLREVTPPTRMVFDSGDPLVEAAIAGIGIVQVMDFAVADALADGRLQRVLQPFEGRSRALSLIYPPSRQHSRSCRCWPTRCWPGLVNPRHAWMRAPGDARLMVALPASGRHYRSGEAIGGAHQHPRSRPRTPNGPGR